MLHYAPKMIQCVKFAPTLGALMTLSLSLRIVIAALATLPLNAAFADDAKRPSYCKDTVPKMILQGVFETEVPCGGGGETLLEQNLLQACSDARKEFPGADCAPVGKPYYRLTPSLRCHDTIQKYQITRPMTQEETVTALCRSITSCMTEAFNRDDRRGIAWANDMSTTLGCK